MATNSNPNTNAKTLSALISDLTRETSVLVRDEVQLAKTELAEKVNQASSGAISLITGALVAFAGLLVLLFAITAGVAILIAPWTTQPWVAPLIVGGIVAIIGWSMVQSGRRRLSAQGLAPKRTIHSLRRDRHVFGG